MKNHLAVILGVVGIISFIFVGCNDPKFCVDCDSDGIVKYTKNYGGDTSITIYPVITPRNYNHCDSFVYYKGTFVEPYKANSWQKLCTEKEARALLLQGNDTTCVCRVNPDTTFNDKIGINDFLFIDGITKFPYNKLFIKVQNDTSKIRTYKNYNNKGDVFNGLVLDTVDIEYVNSRMLASGVFEYELVLYKDEMHQVGFDTLDGKFLIVRSDKICNRNCLKHAFDQKDTRLLK